jgi:hypothetical protein
MNRSSGLAVALGTVLIATVFVSVPAIAGATTTPLVRLGLSPRMPEGTAALGPLPGSTRLSVEVDLRAPDPGALDRFVAEVSEPDSPLYGRYLSAGQFGARFGASPSEIEAVEQWLAGRGLSNPSVDEDRLAVSVVASTSRIDSAFGLTVERYEVPGEADRIAPSAAPLVPSSLAPDVESVLGLSDLGVPRPLMIRSPASHAYAYSYVKRNAAPVAAPRTASPAACEAAQNEASESGAYTSDELADAYSMPGSYAADRFGAGVSVAVYELEPFATSDISSFQACYRTEAPVSVTDVDGGAGAGPGSGESALDIEQVIGLAPDVSVHVYEGPSFETATDAQALDVYRKIADDDSAAVVSTSWGMCEASLPPGFAASESEVFGQMAAQGQSMFAASGDSGSEDCFNADGSPDTALAVDDPGSQPYVTSVGGTSLTALGPPPTESVWNSCKGQREQRCAALGEPEGAGGGGISTIWPMPSWQAGPGVHNQYSSGSPCSASHGDCREVPDISASSDPAHGDVIFVGGIWESVGGTSGAAPLWAAVTAIADQGCTGPGGSASGGHTVGFVNPRLYELGSAANPPFNDVTIGNNDFTDTNSGRYPSTSGFDLATGWGTPLVPALVSGLEPAGGCPSVTGVSPDSGPTSGGTSVTISGPDLAGVTAVHFGSTPARSFSYNSGTQTVTATSPSSPVRGSKDLTVTTRNGTSSSLAPSAFDYVGPSVSAVVPPAGTPQGGTEVLIEGGGFSGATAVHFGATQAVSFSVVPGGQGVLAVSPPQPGPDPVVDVTVTTPVGTSPDYAPDHFVYTLDPVIARVSPASGTVRGDTFVSISGANLSGARAVDFGTQPSRFIPNGPHEIFAMSPPSRTGAGPVAVTVVTGSGRSSFTTVLFTYVEPSPGYWMAASDGGVFSFGGSSFHGSMGGKHLNAPIVGMAATVNDGGYWLVASDGGIFAFGDAAFLGSMGDKHLNAPVVGMAATPDDGGYWLVAADGGVFSFGDAKFYGSMGARHLNKPIVGIAATPTITDGGYWLVASDGGIFAFGNAKFYGSMGARRLNAPVVSIAADPDDSGYWMVGSDGGVFSFGDARFHGSMGGRRLNAPVVSIATTADGSGYWLVASDGGIFAFGAVFSGSAADIRLVAPVVGAAPT